MWPALVVEGRDLVPHLDRLDRFAATLAPSAPPLRPGQQLPARWSQHAIEAEVDRLAGEALSPQQRQALIAWTRRRVASHRVGSAPGIGQADVLREHRPTVPAAVPAQNATAPAPPPRAAATWRRAVVWLWRQSARAVHRLAESRELTPRDVEVHAADLMRKSGIRDARVTSYSGDGGVDVTSSRVVAQVKHQARPVGRPAVQQLHGAAVALGKAGWFYSTSGYTPQAQDFARHAGVKLITIRGVR